jgi:uncharacterized membrane protein
VDLYDLLKFFHVLFAAIWVGTAAQQQFAAVRARMRAQTDPARMIEFADDAEYYGKKLFAPASGLTALFGILIVMQSAWEFKDLWIVIGIALFIASAVIGAAFLSPESGRLRELMTEKGVGDPEVLARVKRINMVVRIDFLILVLVVADMVIKPGV